MHWTDRREAVANIGAALAERGWTIYGWKPNQSDSMTDYYDPEHWEGVAEKGGVVIVVDGYSNQYSGGRPRMRQVESGVCPRCGGDGWEPDADRWSLAAAREDPRGWARWDIERQFGKGSGVMNLSASMGVVSPIGFDYDPERRGQYRTCYDCHSKGKTYRREDYIEPWPTYQVNPERRKWHAEKGGHILCSGIGLSKATGYGKEGVARAGHVPYRPH